jgi:hypothetical protein
LAQATNLASGHGVPSGVNGVVSLGMGLGLSVMLILTGAGSAGCTQKPVAIALPPPPLEVPVVPPRLVGPVMVEEPELPPVETPEPTPPRQKPRPAPVRNDPVTKVEPPPDPNAKPAENSGSQAASTAAQNQPSPLLRTPETSNDTEVVRKVRETLMRAGENLKKVNYNNLNAGAKAQHDTARRFIQQAEEALLKGKSLVFAGYLANKAEDLSASLLNR